MGDARRAADRPAGQGGVVPIEPGVSVEVKFFGRYKGGAIRDGVLLSVEKLPGPTFRRGG
jgi:hypothetical protein